MRLSIAAATLATHFFFAGSAAAQFADPAPPSPFATPAPPPPPPFATPTPAPAPFDADRLVRIEVPAIGRHGALEVYEPKAGYGSDDDESWRKLCESPCAVGVPSGTRLRINGDFRESPAFTAQNQGTMRLAVDPARSGVRLLGIVAAAGGAAVLGLSAYVYASIDPDRPGYDDPRRLTRSDMVGTGVFGLAVLGAGVGLAAWHWRTRVTVDGGAQRGVALAKGVWWTPSGLRF